MLSHDNLCWEAIPMAEIGVIADPKFVAHENRIVSYLPLSHIAGLTTDIMMQLLGGCEVYFARPDALQGTIV